MAKVPSGLLPVIEINGRRLTESSAIMAWIEAEFPDHMPLAVAANDPEFPRYQMLMRLERRLFGDWLQWLTNGWCAEFVSIPNRNQRVLTASLVLGSIMDVYNLEMKLEREAVILACADG